MAFSLRRRPSPVGIETLETAVLVAMRPERLRGVAEKDRPAVKAVADALVNATRPEFPAPRGQAQPPVAAIDLARKAALDLQQTGRTVATPESIEVAMRRHGMDFAEPFGPGRPLVPYVGYDKRPRQYNYMPGRNVTTDTRPDRLPFDIIKRTFEGYDIASICARHTINDIRSMGLLFKPIDGYHGKIDAEVAEAKRFLRKPDGKRNFNTWFAMWAMDVLRYDAGTLWKERNRGAKVTHLKVIDGTTIMPLIDFYGDVPDGDAPAYQQVIQGIPWSDLNAEDVIYEPQWPVSESPYGVAPIETCLINANTDVRLQMFFLEFFTEGAVPEMLLSAPEGMTDPDAIAELQELWDNWMQNNQKGRHGARYIPNGEKPFVYKPYTFDPKLAEYVARRTIAAFGLVPQDLGILDQVNKSSSESQVDTQFRITTLPNTEYYEAILNDVLQNDLELPIACYFDSGREREDRLMEARAHQVYVEMGVESVDEVRTNVLGLPVDTRHRVPRYIDNAKLGPVPIEYMEAVSGKIDPDTLAPVYGTVKPQPYVAPTNMQPPQQGAPSGQGGQPSGQNGQAAAPKAIESGKPKPKPQQQAAKTLEVESELEKFRQFAKRRMDRGRWRDFTFTHLDADLADDLNRWGRQTCAKSDNAVCVCCGGTGEHVTGRECYRCDGGLNVPESQLRDLPSPCDGTKPYGLDSHGHQVELDPLDGWQHLDGSVSEDDGSVVSDGPVTGLNGYRAVDKAYLTADDLRSAARGEPSCAGLALRARDTGRVLMLQRAHTAGDPAAGKLEFPGGHVEDGESCVGGAIREWEEETGLHLPADSTMTAAWDATNGVYRGHVFETSSESNLDLSNRDASANPDGDGFEAIVWLDPADLSMNPTVRRELANDAHLAHAAITSAAAKAGGANPKARQQQRRRRAASAASSATSASSGATSVLRPGPWGHLEALLVAHWTIAIAGALATVITASTVARRWVLEHQGVTNIPPGSDAAQDLARSFTRLLTFDDREFTDVLHHLYADAYLAGGKDALEQTRDANGVFAAEIDAIDWDTWRPGQSNPANLLKLGGFQRLLDQAGVTIKGINDTTRKLIGDIVEEGLARGWSAQQIADAIDEILRDPQRAHLIAVTEVNRAMSAASMQMYRDNDVPMWDLLTAADPCQKICAPIARANPHRMDDGTPIPPEHPQCRCAVAPHYPEV